MNRPTYNHWSDQGLETLSDTVEQLFRDSRPNDLSEIFTIAMEYTHKGKMATYTPCQVARYAARRVTENAAKRLPLWADVAPDDHDDNHHHQQEKHPEYIGAPPNYMTPPGVAQAEHDHRDNMATRHQVRRNRKRNRTDTPNEGHRYNDARTAYSDGRCKTVGTLYAHLWRQQS
jgi:hypothetical protein